MELTSSSYILSKIYIGLWPVFIMSALYLILLCFYFVLHAVDCVIQRKLVKDKDFLKMLAIFFATSTICASSGIGLYLIHIHIF